MENKNIVEIVANFFKKMIRSIYGQQCMPFYNFEKDYFEEYWDLLQQISYEVIEEFFISKLKTLEITMVERIELILSVIGRKFDERDFQIYEGDSIFKECFHKHWWEIKTKENFKDILFPHFSLPDDEIDTKEEHKKLNDINVNITETKSVKEEIREINREVKRRKQEDGDFFWITRR
jgi:hypothetical protein